jgi:glycerate 2-kinase
VIGDSLASIASGLCEADPTTFQDAGSILKKYNLFSKIPTRVLDLLNAGMEGRVPETPKIGDPAFLTTTNILIGTNWDAVNAAALLAKDLGYNVVKLTSRLEGEARHAAGFLWNIALDIKKHMTLCELPACIICGGETTVTLKGDGLGGRNQEMALAFLGKLSDDPQGAENIYFLSGGTDGNDGPTDAAGAFADLCTVKEMKIKRLNYIDYLENNNSYHFFDDTDSLFKTGPTNTNVCDVQIILIV